MFSTDLESMNTFIFCIECDEMGIKIKGYILPNDR